MTKERKIGEIRINQVVSGRIVWLILQKTSIFNKFVRLNLLKMLLCNMLKM